MSDDFDAEIDAMRSIYPILEPLDAAARQRVLQHLCAMLSQLDKAKSAPPALKDAPQ